MQLIKGVSRVLLKLFKYANVTAISASLVLTATLIFLVILALILNDS